MWSLSEFLAPKRELLDFRVIPKMRDGTKSGYLRLQLQHLQQHQPGRGFNADCDCRDSKEYSSNNNCSLNINCRGCGCSKIDYSCNKKA